MPELFLLRCIGRTPLNIRGEGSPFLPGRFEHAAKKSVPQAFDVFPKFLSLCCGLTFRRRPRRAMRRPSMPSTRHLHPPQEKLSPS